MAWLVCHVLAFSALVPRDCCEAHRHREAATSACHEMTTPESAHCPRPDAASCPLHHAPAPAPDDCRLWGTCNVADAALSAVLLRGAVPDAPVALASPSWTLPDAAPAATEGLVRQILPPDPPPPRA